MTVSLTRLARFAGRHWLRLIVIGCALFLLSQKQINFNLRLGSPPAETTPAGMPDRAGDPAAENAEPIILTEEQTASSGFLDRFNFFGGGGEATLFDLLVQQDEAAVEAHLTRFSNVAQAEQEKFGVPASVTLAASLLYSRGGMATAAGELNNFFGLDCTGDWSGATGRAGGKCLRRYENAWTSFRDFSLYVTSDKFRPMKQFGPNDYRRWAAGLEELGFNSTEDLAGQLQRTIDKYQLFRFD